MMKQASPVLDDDVVVAHGDAGTGLGGGVFNEKLDGVVNGGAVVTAVDIVVPGNAAGVPSGPADGGVKPSADVKEVSAIPTEVVLVKATDAESQPPASISHEENKTDGIPTEPSVPVPSGAGKDVTATDEISNGPPTASATAPAADSNGPTATKTEAIPLPTQNGTHKAATASVPPANGPTGKPGPPPKKPGPPRPDPARLAALSSTINSNLILLSSAEGGPECETARVKAAAAAQELTNALRAPPESVMNWFINASIVSVVRVFQDWGVFDVLPMPTPGLPPSEQGMPVPTLAAKVEAEESILLRLAYMLTSSSILHLSATTPARLSHTPTSLALRSGQPMGAMFRLMFTNVVSTSTILPSYFSTYGRREPLGPSHIPTSFLAGRPDLDYFTNLNLSPAATEDFMLAMAIAHRNAPTTGMYDMAPILAAAAAEPSRPVWIDVGGGDGHTVSIFRRAFPSLPASQCLIHDLPEVCAQASTPSDPELRGVKWLPMDFHADAPVAGGRAYYLRHVLRDYSDATATRILRNVARGLTRGDARILVAEQVSTEPPMQYAAFKDFTMLAIGGKDRTLEGFKGVAKAAGLEVEKVWWDRGTPHAVIEMRLMGEGEGGAEGE